MRIYFLTLCLLLICSIHLPAQRKVNYDESKIKPYTLEDPLQFANGKKVQSISDWQLRRKEILDIFQQEMYGTMPAPSPVYLQLIEQGTTLEGFGLRRQVRMFFRQDNTGPYIDWLIVTPKHVKTRVPCTLLLNYYGNHTLLKDKEVIIPDSWLDNNKTFKIRNNHASEDSRGMLSGPNYRSTYPISSILARGYGIVTACYGDISPDPEDVALQDSLPYTRIFDLWGKRNPSCTSNTTSITAWGWALMRAMDMIEKDSIIDAGRVVLAGSSRLAKAAMIAGAFDERFPVVVLNQTGGGGVPLTKRAFGENVDSETSMFTHWFCKAYKKYAHQENTMTFDQHLFLSCIAPRALLVEGFNNPWFDTKGEFLALQAASPVWKKFTKQGLPNTDWPEIYDTSAIGDNLGYVRRDQQHGIAPIDWKWMLDFADKVFSKSDKH